MSDDGDGAVLRIPARELRPPAFLSDHAQAVLLQSRPPAEHPPLDDIEAWRQLLAAMEEMIVPMMEPMAAQTGSVVTDIELDGVTVYDIAPSQPIDGGESYIQFEIHGGALVSGGGRGCQLMGSMAARRTGLRSFAVDYRMPPDHPYPAGLDDCLTVYRALLRDHDPAHIFISGGSAGGNLVGATILRARDEGLPLPGAAIMMTPEVDLTESGDSFQTNLGVDTILGLLMPINLLYAAGHDLAHPYLSPLFGDFTKGFPPTFLQTGTRDLFLSNTVRMHRALLKAGVPAELHVFEAMPHGGFFGAPEDDEVADTVRDFVARRIAA